MKASELIEILNHCIEQYGDRPVYYTDQIVNREITCYPESAANFDSPKAVLIKAGSIV